MKIVIESTELRQVVNEYVSKKFGITADDIKNVESHIQLIDGKSIVGLLVEISGEISLKQTAPYR